MWSWVYWVGGSHPQGPQQTGYWVFRSGALLDPWTERLCCCPTEGQAVRVCQAMNRGEA